jgi:hypothetical protein
VQGIAQRRSHQQVRVYQREQPVADSFATPPGTPQTIRIRGGEAAVARVGRARLAVGSHRTNRLIVALKDAGEAPPRELRAAALTWRTRDLGQGHTRRWLGAVLVPDWQSPEGGSQLTMQPGEEGARRRVSLSLLVDHGLVFHPDHQAQLKPHLPA